MGHVRLFAAAAVTAALLATLTGCGGTSTTSAPATGASSANGTGTLTVAGQPSSGTSAPGSANPGSPTSPTAPISGTTSSSYALCPNMDPSSTTPASFTQQLGGGNIVDSGSQSVLGFPVNYTVTVSPSLSIQASPSQSVITTTLNVVSANPTSVMATAQQTASQASGTTTTTFATASARAGLAAASASWANIFCTLQPSTQTASAPGGNNVLVSYNPPIPNSVSPLAAAASYAAELGSTLTFSTTASVQQSSNAAVVSGTTYPGTVTVQSVAPTLSTTDASGNPLSITADVAYTITSNFGTNAVTSGLGLLLSATFYIDTTTHTYKAIVAQTNNTTVPQVVFTSN